MLAGAGKLKQFLEPVLILPPSGAVAPAEFVFSPAEAEGPALEILITGEAAAPTPGGGVAPAPFVRIPFQRQPFPSLQSPFMLV